MVKQILISLSITLVVSTLGAFSLSRVLGFWESFCICTILQFVLFYIYNNFTINNQKLKHEQIINERLDILSKNVISFQCPCGKKNFEEIIYINEENTFRCDKCNEDIKLDIVLTPIVKTTPIDIEETYSKLQSIQ